MNHVPVGVVPVSIVIPAFNEARRLPTSLPRLTAVAGRIPGAELIVIDDGSTDGTAALAERLLRDVPGARVIRLPWNSGKGTAIRVGVSFARGESIVFMDADMASDVGDLGVLLAELAHADIVLGSRRIGADAVRTNGRRFGSWAFNRVTRSLTDLDVADTQCGFKAFRRAEAKILFGMARSTGFGFDVEVLSIAKSLGYRVVEVPIRWAEVPGGTFRVTRHTPAMLVDVVRSRRYRRRTGPAFGLTHLEIIPHAPADALPPSPPASAQQATAQRASAQQAAMQQTPVEPGTVRSVPVQPPIQRLHPPLRGVEADQTPGFPASLHRLAYADGDDFLAMIGVGADGPTNGTGGSAEPPGSRHGHTEAV